MLADYAWQISLLCHLFTGSLHLHDSSLAHSLQDDLITGDTPTDVKFPESVLSAVENGAPDATPKFVSLFCKFLVDENGTATMDCHEDEAAEEPQVWKDVTHCRIRQTGARSAISRKGNRIVKMGGHEHDLILQMSKTMTLE